MTKQPLPPITPVATLAAALEGAALVQENVRETIEVKRAIFAEMDKLAAPDTILASSTSWIPVSEFSAGLPGRGRIGGASGQSTPPGAAGGAGPCTVDLPGPVERARELYARAAQSPVLLKKRDHWLSPQPDPGCGAE